VRWFQSRLAGQCRQQLQSLRIEAPEVESYQRVAVVPGAPQCDILLHIVKSIPDFTGVQDEYVARRHLPPIPMNYLNLTSAVARITKPL